MTKRYEVDGLLFDLDGTMLDTVADLAEATNRMLRELRQPERTVAEVTAFIGNGIRVLVKRSVSEGRESTPALLEEAYHAFQRHYAEVNGLATRPYPGVMEALTDLQSRGLKLGCVTNKSEAFIFPVLDGLGMSSFFGSVVGGDTLPQRKPDPEPLLHACRQLGIEPRRTLMVGDSPNDALAARRAEIPVLLVTYGYSAETPLEEIDCDGLINSLEDLSDWLA
ncbi:phosphoglycolate phosphatase [Holophaga foetida]|uniref:phosphoglycolate phosphatase n=1 Tax=Holophaga foetida TaxID=35839 RepID=UPI0002473B2A|nr:phosphoglycolate phosphatase [Holophaga foetida]